jgi:hypothetical protein
MDLATHFYAANVTLRYNGVTEEFIFIVPRYERCLEQK